MNCCFLGIDVGSVSCNFVAIDQNLKLIKKVYLRTQGQPITIIKKGLSLIKDSLQNYTVQGVATTGSGRQLAALVVGADVVKNEITAHAVAALNCCPEVRTVLEIGGQDSKIIILKDKIVYDFAMNTVCAAGTGSFLDRQAARLGIPIEDFGGYAIKSKNPVRIAGRCAVFAESDMIHKQQTGQSLEDIINGLCQALVRNYLNNIAKGKTLEEPIIFQGGVAANIGIVAAFEKELNAKIIVPEHYDVMGALGAAFIAKENYHQKGYTFFSGFGIIENNYKTSCFQCTHCANNCEVIELTSQGRVMARWGDRCGKWARQIKEKDITKAI